MSLAAEIAQQDRGGEVALFLFFFYKFPSLLENVAAMLRRKRGRQTRAKDAARMYGRTDAGDRKDGRVRHKQEAPEANKSNFQTRLLSGRLSVHGCDFQMEFVALHLLQR